MHPLTGKLGVYQDALCRPRTARKRMTSRLPEIPIDAGCEMQHHTRMPKLALEQSSPPVEDDSPDLLPRISRRGFAGSAAAVAAAAFSPAARLLAARRHSQQ